MWWVEIPTNEKGQLNRLAEIRKQIEECKAQLYDLIAEANILEAGLCKPYELPSHKIEFELDAEWDDEIKDNSTY